MSAAAGELLGGYLMPYQPLPVLAPEANAGWASLAANAARIRAEIEASGADLLLLFSTRWVSIIGHQMQADPKPEWWVVDEDFHEFGTLHYSLRMDAEFATAYRDAARARGLHARTVAYQGFPIDVGTITTLKLLNPDNRIAASVVSCNAYSDRAETLVLGKAAADAVRASGRKAIAIGVSALSNRMFSRWIDPAQDRIHSQKDDEWNRKLLELLAAESGLRKAEIKLVLGALDRVIEASMGPKGGGQFTMPGLLKMATVPRPAVKARKGINPFTGEETWFKAKPPSTRSSTLYPFLRSSAAKYPHARPLTPRVSAQC